MTPRRVVSRLGRTRFATLARERVAGRPRPEPEPLVSVVVPFHDNRLQLATTLESLLAQTARRLEVLLVDDGSTDGSRQVADRYAAKHPHVRVLEQPHRGVGAARNLGAAAAQGDYLVFCDADDVVAASGYERLAGTLRASGSDLAVGSVSVQVKGRYEVPEWARRANPDRRLGATVTDVPHLLGNLVLGARMFRRTFWDAQRLRFADDERGDPLLVVSSLLAARSVDVLPAVVYRWSWREDNRSLLQRDLRDRERVAARVRSMREPGRLLVEEGSERLAQVYFAEVLHVVVADLVRAAVCRDDGYWEALSAELHALVATMSPETFGFVPVQDRVATWLCAHGERAATEEFLEYAFDNSNGFPFRVQDGWPRIDLPFIDALADADDALSRVALADMRYRARLVRVGWHGDELALEGAAFAEYLDDRSGASAVTLVLVERTSGREVRLPARSGTSTVPVNQWAGRASEDHTGAGFTVTVPARDLARDWSGGTTLEAEVELALGGFVLRAPFRSRQAAASPGLLEPRWLREEGLAVRPAWREHRGLAVVLEAAGEAAPPPAAPHPVAVHAVSGAAGAVRLEGTAPPGALELALVGPRGASSWTQADVVDGRFSAEVGVLVDEWGLGATSLPADLYAVRARCADGKERAVGCALELWRALPRPVDSESWTFVPLADPATGSLNLRVVPVEYQLSRPALHRRRLRDELYPAAKRQPLVDVVLFETFAGKGTGDNPGAVCAELLRRDLGLDLVYAVLDRSTVVPAGVRTVIRWSPEWFELLGRARYLVVNSSLPYFFRKREGQLYYQTWHGTPLKRIAHDRPHLDFFNWHHRRQLLVARSGWDFLLSQSEFCTTALSSAFRYDGPVMEVGYPRNDVLVSPDAAEVRRRTRAHFGLAEGDLAVLYAPTWRDNIRHGAVFDKVLYLDPEELVRDVPHCTVLVRGHYNSVGAADERSASGRVLDVTRYPDIADLYLAADVLVTDYSSVFFDFSLTDKPMVFLAPDLVEYRDDNRGFYLDYHDVVPGPVCVTTAEVAAAIMAPDELGEVREAFRARFNPLDDGSAAARVVDGILAAFPLGGSPSAPPGDPAGA